MWRPQPRNRLKKQHALMACPFLIAAALRRGNDVAVTATDSPPPVHAGVAGRRRGAARAVLGISSRSLRSTEEPPVAVLGDDGSSVTVAAPLPPTLPLPPWQFLPLPSVRRVSDREGRGSQLSLLLAASAGGFRRRLQPRNRGSPSPVHNRLFTIVCAACAVLGISR